VARERDKPSTKSLIDKLGVKSNAHVAVLGIDDAGFERDLMARTRDVSRGRPRKDLDLVFFAATDHARLRRLASLRDTIRPEGGIWVVWQKGKPDLNEDDVREAALKAGLVDVKVVSFSQTLSALKLVIPVARRR
jgi:hypothetical protein